MAYSSWEEVTPQPGKQTEVFRMIANGEVDFMLAGGSRGGGKSELITMMPLLYINDPGYRGLFLRREYSEIMGANGLWEKAQNMYPLFNGRANISDKIWKFPGGANQRFRHLFTENDTERYRGQGFSYIGIDEIDQFSKSSVTFLMTCLRSEANMDSFMVGTLNPNPDSWCLPLVKYYLNDEGFPDPDKQGDIRWFIVKDGDFIFGPSEEYFQENYSECLWITMPGQDEPIYVRPKRFTFCFFSILDNPALVAQNPVYLSELQNLPDHERDTQLFGNWYSRPKGMSLWRRQWVRGEEGEKVKRYMEIPNDISWFRGVDKGYSEPHDTNRTPDPTFITPKLGKDYSGMYWIVGDYAPDCLANAERHKPYQERLFGEFCKLSGERDQTLLNQMLFDGEESSIVLSRDSGAGATDHTYTKSLMVENGVHVIEDKSPKNTPNKKMKDFLPFSNACEIGLVYIVEESFNVETLEHIYKRLENFDPTKKSTGIYKDDVPDGFSNSFNAASSTRLIKTVVRNQTHVPTHAAEVLNNSRDISMKNFDKKDYLDGGIDERK